MKLTVLLLTWETEQRRVRAEAEGVLGLVLNMLSERGNIHVELFSPCWTTGSGGEYGFAGYSSSPCVCQQLSTGWLS